MFAKLNTLHNSVISLSDLTQILGNLTRLYGEDRVPKFNNLLSYYKVAGLQVSFIQNKIIFAVHFPILHPNTFDYFHLYPIPKNDLTLIPESPYLILGTAAHQYQDDECPRVEDLHICPDHLHPTEEDCIISIIKEAETNNCQSIPVHVHRHFVQLINDQYVLVVPATNTIKIKQKCSSNGHLVVHQPSLLKIAPNCSIWVDNIVYSNKQQSIKGEPFHLPAITVSEISRSYARQPLRLQHVDLDNIFKLKKEADALQIRDFETQNAYIMGNQVALPLAAICTLAVMAAALYVLWRRRPRRTPERPSNPEAQENNPSVLFSNLMREELHM